jgi:palmitoyltransferase
MDQRPLPCPELVRCAQHFGPLSIMIVTIFLPAADYFVVLSSYFDPVNAYPRSMRALAICHCVVLAILAFMILFSLFCAWCCDPGATHRHLASDLLRFNFLTADFISQLPKCPHCGLPKPPRAHHCRICGKCVLKMDHHCPAVGNCVALRTYRPFLVMLIWGTIGCAVMAVFCVAEGLADDFVPDKRLMSFLLGGVAAFVAVLLGLFFADQMRRAVRNQTTLEAIGGEDPRYDIGVRENLRQVFGGSVCGWLWPVPDDRLSGFEWSLPEYRAPTMAAEGELPERYA